MFHVIGGLAEAALDHRVGIGAAPAQPPFEFLPRRRQNKNGHALGHCAADLRRALPVDFEDQVLAALEAELQGRAVDLVVSDMAPNLSGVAESDAARMSHLIELAVAFSLSHLRRPSGALVCKAFHGSGYSQLVKLFKDSFRIVKPLKPKASRDKSAETFLIGIGPKAE